MDYATKYLGEEVTVTMDRQMGATHPRYGFVYPINYGYIPNTEAPDGGEVDAYVLGVFEPLEQFTGTCIAVVHRTDDNDDTLIVVPKRTDYSDEQILALVEFQERFFSPTVIRNADAA